jgi:hypothetical protein
MKPLFYFILQVCNGNLFKNTQRLATVLDQAMPLSRPQVPGVWLVTKVTVLWITVHKTE